jgi:hypothetical protein
VRTIDCNWAIWAFSTPAVGQGDVFGLLVQEHAVKRVGAELPIEVFVRMQEPYLLLHRVKWCVLVPGS